ncbi:MAG: HAD-IA family hydrolase [Candidatus Atribacteria bacterium]|nr:HAD-IA family hydrolase [Candidatus Atribacteria bacterium]
MSQKRYLYYIWDFDGTLFDTYPVITAAFQHALRDEGIQESSEVLSHSLQLSVDSTIVMYQNRSHLEGLFIQHYLGYLASSPEKDQPPFPGAREICERVVREGGKNFLVSHKGILAIMSLLDFYSLTHLFTDIISRENGFPRKPDPGAFLHLARKYVLDPQEVLTIGDRWIDMEAAKEAGMATCLIDPGDTLPGYEVDYRVRELGEVPRIIG